MYKNWLGNFTVTNITKLVLTDNNINKIRSDGVHPNASMNDINLQICGFRVQNLSENVFENLLNLSLIVVKLN